MARGGAVGSPDWYKVAQPEAERRKDRPTLATHPLVMEREATTTKRHRSPWATHGKVARKAASE